MNRNTKETTRHRIQLDFSEKAFGKLTKLRDSVGAESYTDTITGAISVLMYFIKTQENGDKILIEDNKSRVQREVTLEIPFNFSSKNTL
jgi:hypothetical protein